MVGDCGDMSSDYHNPDDGEWDIITFKCLKVFCRWKDRIKLSLGYRITKFSHAESL